MAAAGDAGYEMPVSTALVRDVSIENYKSIRKLTVELGRVNVLIGANGSGKSNLLEAIAYGSAAARNKLDNEYLAPRGIRVADARFMRAAFTGVAGDAPIVVSFAGREGPPREYRVSPERASCINTSLDDFEAQFESLMAQIRAQLPRLRSPNVRSAFPEQEARLRAAVHEMLQAERPPDFLIYAPENSALRVFQAEAQVLPLGVRGEGLFAHLKALEADRLAAIGEHLALLDWFERLEIPTDLAPGERSLRIRDRYLAEGALFDQRSANEGFLFLLFYLTLFLSDATPSFFAIDNVDASLNPKLATTLVRTLVELAVERSKQVIFTTHSPAVLDGLDLRDDEQRLFVTERSKDGATRIRRVKAPVPLDGDAPVPLSEAFVRGYLGGLPKSF